jgi:hypothetical protein
MVQTSLEHAEAAKRALQEIAEKNEQAKAQQEEHKTETSSVVAEPKNGSSETIVPPAETAAVKSEPELPQPKEIDKIRHCEACGFPVSPGRTLCVDCEAARLSGDSPAPLASSYAPAFLARFENRKEQGWLAANLYTIGTVLIVALTVVLLILRLR